MKIRVTGLRELQSKIRKLEDKDLRKELRAANKSAAEIVADQAAREAPKATGRLARSVKASAGQRDASIKAGTAARVPYAAAINFGWKAKGIQPNPFLYRAMAKVSDKASDVYETKIRALAERLGTRRR